MPKTRPTEIEKLRIAMGLSAPQMLRILGAKPSHRSLLNGAFKVDPIFVRVAEEVMHDYLTWRNWVESQFEEGEIKTTFEVSRLLDISEWNILQLIGRRYIAPYKSTGRQHYFDRASITELFVQNATCLSGQQDGRCRGPLATPFLAWRKRTGRDKSVRFSQYVDLKERVA